MRKKQSEFLKAVAVSSEPDALRNSVVAAFERNRIYRGTPRVAVADREDLRCALRAEIRNIASDYSKRVEKKKHCENVHDLSNQLTTQFSGFLDGKRFKIGTAQKALNLYLKFLWCLGIHEHAPPHCPLDKTILKKVGIKEAWTKLDCIQTYENWMNTISDWIKGNSNKKLPMKIAEWELENWTR